MGKMSVAVQIQVMDRRTVLADIRGNASLQVEL